MLPNCLLAEAIWTRCSNILVYSFKLYCAVLSSDQHNTLSEPVSIYYNTVPIKATRQSHALKKKKTPFQKMIYAPSYFAS